MRMKLSVGTNVENVIKTEILMGPMINCRGPKGLAVHNERFFNVVVVDFL